MGDEGRVVGLGGRRRERKRGWGGGVHVLKAVQGRVYFCDDRFSVLR